MSPTDYDEDETNESDKPEGWRKRLDQVKGERDQTKAERDAMAKRLAIYEAGLSGLSKDQLEAVSKLHDSDDLSAESIKATAAKYGFAATETNEDVVTADEIAAQQRVAAASAGATTSASTASAEAQLDEAMEKDGGRAGPNFYAKAAELGLQVGNVPTVQA